MASRTTRPQQPQQANLTLEKMQQAVPRLRKRIDELIAFQPEALTSEDEARAAVPPLSASIDDALIRTFGANTVEYERLRGAARFRWPMSYARATPVSEIRASLARHKQQALGLLEEAIKSLEEQIEEVGSSVAEVTVVGPPLVDSRKVFLVHGHDVGSRETVARFLERAGFDPIILHEQANKGRTVIEKFEANAEVGFAVALLTPDDLGRAAVEDSVHDRSRARQNVILELGYFIGRLGRGRVCALKSGDLELPSDIIGVVWIDFDPSGGWKTELAKELQAASYEIDWNNVMKP